MDIDNHRIRARTAYHTDVFRDLSICYGELELQWIMGLHHPYDKQGEIKRDSLYTKTEIRLQAAA